MQHLLLQAHSENNDNANPKISNKIVKQDFSLLGLSDRSIPPVALLKLCVT